MSHASRNTQHRTVCDDRARVRNQRRGSGGAEGGNFYRPAVFAPAVLTPLLHVRPAVFAPAVLTLLLHVRPAVFAPAVLTLLLHT